MKAILLCFALFTGIMLPSCQKMAFRHHCVCQLKRTTGSAEEDLGIIEKNQMGTYSTAKDSCNKLQETHTYTANKASGTEIYTATCEIE